MVAEMILPTNGTLKKWTNYVSGWQDRHFEIKSGNLQYYKSKHEQFFGCRGSLSLRSVNVTAHEFDECEFTVSVGSELVWYLKAENCHSKLLWMRSILRDTHDSDYSSTSTTKSHSRNSSALSSLCINTDLEDNQQFSSLISELEAYRTMCCEQMSSIQRELNVLLDPSTPSLLSIKATHLALLNNMNRIIEIMKGPKQEDKDERSIDQSLDESESVVTVKDSRPLSSVDITSGDEWHDADEHSSFGSIEQGEEARASATPSPRDSMEPVPPTEPGFSTEPVRRNLPFGHYDDVLMPSGHNLFDEVETLATEQLKYALAGVEDNVWTLFAQDGAMRMFTREIQDAGGLPVDPLKAIHEVKGVSALEFMHYFFDAKYKMDWDHTLNDMKIIEAVSRDTYVLHQKHKTVWPAAPRESLFVSHIRRVDNHKRKDAHDLYIVCNKDIQREDVPLGSSSSVRVGLTVSMICETVILNPTKKLDELTRDDIKCNIIYVSQVHPGGWVPVTALRHVYKKEYPRFLRTFTEFVLKNVKGKNIVI